MNEQAARDLLLAWALESSDADLNVVTPQQRQHLAQVARDEVHTQSPSTDEGLPERFLARRAALVLHAVGAQTPALPLFLARNKLFAALAAGLPIAAFLVGLLVDRLGSPHRVDLLSAPLLLIVLWNLLVYVWLAVALFRPKKHDSQAGLGWLGRWATGLAWLPKNVPQPWPAALAIFTTHWMHTSAPLTRVRVLRVVHVCAAALALGAVASLYTRGLLVQYQVGWESTFLRGEQVQGLLSLLFKPAMLVFGMQGFSLAEVQALQWPHQAPVDGGARWVHLFAATLLLLVVLPRCVLAAVAYGKERRLARRFHADTAHPYVRDVLGAVGLGATGTVLRVFPYSFTVDIQRSEGLQVLARRQLGAQAQVLLQASTAYGEDLAPAGVVPRSLDVALFNLSATPEAENHGAFLDSLVQQGTMRLEVWVDASAYQQRLLGSSPERLEQRSALWRSLGAARNLPVQIVHLVQPETPTATQAAQQQSPVVLVPA